MHLFILVFIFVSLSNLCNSLFYEQIYIYIYNLCLFSRLMIYALSAVILTAYTIVLVCMLERAAFTY